MNDRRARNSIRGRQAKAAGDAFELWLEYQHAAARRLGILAHIEHNEPHFKFINGKWTEVAPGVSDYTGVLDRSGLTVAIEAKSTKDDRLMRSAVSPKQQAHLNAVAKAGGLAILAVEFRGECGWAAHTSPLATMPCRHYAALWQKVPWQVLRTAESVSEPDLLEGGWAIAHECYLERWHARGTPSIPPQMRSYARE